MSIPNSAGTLVLARISALSYKAQNNQLLVLEDFDFEAPKTKEFLNLQKNFNLDNKKSLLVLKEGNNNIYLSSRNLHNSKVVTLSELNTYDIMNATTVLFVESSLGVLQSK